MDAARLLRAMAEAEADAAEQRTPNINTGTLYGGQSVTHTVVTGDYIAGHKAGKKNKKKGR
ncbi:hypothetical protein ACWEV4_21140 [Streptomyces sp. NPDC003860]